MTMARRVKNPGEAAVNRRRRGRVRMVLHLVAWLGGKLATPALLIALYFGARWSLGQVSAFDVQQVAIRNNNRADAQEILQMSGLSATDNLFRINCEEVSALVRKHPWVSQAAVYRRFPGTVVIEVSEHVPVLAANLNAGEGSLSLVSETGEFFKEATPAEAAQWPLLSGLTAKDVEHGSRRVAAGVSSALALLSMVKERGMPPGEELAEIEVIGDEGSLAVLTTREGKAGTRIVLGPPPFEEKWRRLSRVWADLAQRKVPPRNINFVTDTKVIVAPADTVEAKI